MCNSEAETCAITHPILESALARSDLSPRLQNRIKSYFKVANRKNGHRLDQLGSDIIFCEHSIYKRRVVVIKI